MLREFGLVLREQGAFARAEALFIEGLNLHRAANERAGMAFALIGLGDLARDQGDGPRVREYIEPSLATVRELGLEWATGFALNSLALGVYYEHDLARASSLIHESVALFRGLKAPASLAEVLITQGKIERAHGDLAAAYDTLREALQFAVAVGPRLMLAAALEELANVLIAQNHAALVVHMLAAASGLRVQMEAPLPPADENAVKQTLMIAQGALGTTEFTARWAAAEALPTEHMLDALMWPQVS